MSRHAHYFKDVRHLTELDVYRVLSLFGVTDQALGHAIKKLLVAGGRGVKDIDRDVQEAIDTLIRWQGMRAEDARYPAVFEIGQMPGNPMTWSPTLGVRQRTPGGHGCEVGDGSPLHQSGGTS